MLYGESFTCIYCMQLPLILAALFLPHTLSQQLCSTWFSDTKVTICCLSVRRQCMTVAPTLIYIIMSESTVINKTLPNLFTLILRFELQDYEELSVLPNIRILFYDKLTRKTLAFTTTCSLKDVASYPSTKFKIKINDNIISIGVTSRYFPTHSFTST